VHAIGIDIGTSNVKAVVVDAADGARCSAAVRPLTWHRDGPVAEQDPAALWEAVLEAVAEALHEAAMAGVPADAVGVVGLCGQYSSIAPVDAAGAPIGPLRLYFDQRGTEPCFELLGRHDDAFATWVERHPIPPVGGGLALGHVLALQRDDPDRYERTAAHLEVVDLVAAQLTGTIAATQGSVFAGQLVDNRTLSAAGYDPDLVRMAGVDPDRLPPLVPLGSVVGHVRSELAGRLGLRSDVAVVAGLTDSAAQAVATGADRPGRVGACIGTTGVVLSSAPALGADFDHEIFTMPGARPDRYLVSAENGIAGRAVEHVLDRVLGRPGVDPFDGFEGALAASPAGCRGVRFLPWLSGSMSPATDASVRGGFVGMSLDSERADLVRATAEGVAQNLRWLLGPVESFTGEVVEEVVLTGGAARSPGWVQVLADVLQLPVRPLADPGSSGAVAAARWAAACVAGGGPTALAEADGEHLGLATSGTVEPDPATADAHAEAHGQFVAAFEALRPLRLGLR
jgi:xylulokinase